MPLKDKPDQKLVRNWNDPETVIAFLAILVLGGLVALGLNGPLKGGLLTIVGYFFGRPLLQGMLGNKR